MMSIGIMYAVMIFTLTEPPMVCLSFIATLRHAMQTCFANLGLKTLFSSSGFWAILALTLPLPYAWAQAPLPTHTEPGAAIIRGIANYTRWPTGNPVQPFGTPHPLHICLMGHDATTHALEQTINDPSIRTHTLPGLDATPAYISANIRAMGCHMLYQALPSSESTAATLPYTSGVLREIAGSSVLTLGRYPDFCSVGGMFCLHSDSSGFVANISAISRSPLRINPQVLQLGKKPKGQ